MTAALNASKWSGPWGTLGALLALLWPAPASAQCPEYLNDAGQVGFELQWTVCDDALHGQLRSQGNGWVELGFGDPNGFRDTLTAFRQADGGFAVVDGFAEPGGAPQPDDDGGQDVTLVDGARTATHTRVEFIRPLAARDSQDRTLTPGPITLTWAFHASLDDPSQVPTNEGRFDGLELFVNVVDGGTDAGADAGVDAGTDGGGTGPIGGGPGHGTDDPIDLPGGCGCTQAPGTWILAGLTVAGVAWRRRRRA